MMDAGIANSSYDAADSVCVSLCPLRTDRHMRAACDSRRGRRFLSGEDGDGRGELERRWRLRHARARDRAAHRQAYARKSVFIVRNMPGAGGITATNFLYNNAERDGTIIGLVQNNTPFEPLFGTKEARYDPVKFNWLGSPSPQTPMVLLWHTVPVNPGADPKTHEIAVGVSGANSTPAFFTRLLNATLGTKLKPINGYPGQNDVLLAMERRELDGHPSAFFSSVRSTRPTWLREKIAKAIVQYGPEKLD